MKRIIIALGLMGFLVTLWSGAWLFVANQIDQQIQIASNPANPEMTALNCENFGVTGFPFRFDATCSNATISQGDVRITSPQIKTSTLVYRPTHLLAFAESPIHISDAFYGTEHEMRFDLAQASLRLSGWRLGRFSVHAENISYFDTLLGDSQLATSPEVELHLIDIPTEHDPENARASLAFFARAKTTQLPILAVNDGEVTIEAKVTALPNDIRRLASPSVLRQWQAAGGQILLENFSANDTITSIEMTGEAALDETGTINGRVNGTSNQLAERFGDLVAPQFHAMFFGAAQPDGSYKQTLSIVKGTVFVGITPIATLIPLF